jgi:hypothetical protein
MTSSDLAPPSDVQGYSEAQQEDYHAASPAGGAVSLLPMVQKTALLQHEGKDEPTVPLHLFLGDYRKGLKPVGYIPERLGRAIQEPFLDDRSLSGDSQSLPALLEYHSQVQKESTNPERKFEGKCWVFPAEVVALGFTALTQHMTLVARVCEKVFHRRKVTGSERIEIPP